MKPKSTPFSFLSHALSIEGSAAPLIMGRVALFGLWAFAMSVIHKSEHLPNLNIAVAPYELAGAALGLLMVLRTNAGYERWWEGRKLWGAIVNDSRSLAISAVSLGPADPEWRSRVVRRVATFAHVARRSLRGQRMLPEVVALLGQGEADALIESDHMPTAAARDLARDLREGLPDFAFLQADSLRVRLIDSLGGCERIAKTPLPMAYAIEVRRFILLFLASLPFVLFEQLPKSQVLWAVPLLVVLVAYPFLAIDKIGHEMQHPFEIYRLNHLPLDEITSTIERNLLALIEPSPKPANSP
jgi:ion channel-forming bestrophin family protein